MVETILIIIIVAFILISRFGKNDSVVGSAKGVFNKVFSKVIPYSHEDAKRIAKEMGQQFNSKQIAFQYFIFAIGGGAIAFL